MNDDPRSISPLVDAITRAFARRPRRGISAKSAEARRRSSVRTPRRRGPPQPALGSYRQHDALVRHGLAQGVSNPSQRSWQAWVTELETR